MVPMRYVFVLARQRYCNEMRSASAVVHVMVDADTAGDKRWKCSKKL